VLFKINLYRYTKMQGTAIGCLSDGQKSRIVFAMINMRNPNLLLLVGLLTS
jgi:ATPase subunit of ABC transporter with duplicated ATPase domains